MIESLLNMGNLTQGNAVMLLICCLSFITTQLPVAFRNPLVMIASRLDAPEPTENGDCCEWLPMLARVTQWICRAKGLNHGEFQASEDAVFMPWMKQAGIMHLKRGT